MSVAERRSLSPLRRAGRWALWTAAAGVTLVVVTLAVARAAASLRERVPGEALRPPSGQLVAAGGGRMFLQENGPQRGRAVVFVHGTGAWSEIWSPVASPLAAAGFRTIAVDLPPFGFSDRSPGGDYTPETQARRLWAALDALRADTVILVGHSFGARTTVAAALMRPARIARLVLVDAALGLSAPPEVDPTAPPVLLRAALGVGPLRNALVAATVTNPLMTRTLVGALVARPERLTDTQIAMLKRPLWQPGTTRAAGVWLRGFMLDAGPPVAQARRALAAFPAPAHVIWGELDSLTPVSDGEDLVHLLRCASWDVLPGAGHIPGLEAPQDLARTLLGRLTTAPACGVSEKRGGR